MADAYGSGPYGRKSLRVQLPFRPFFWESSMRKYGYQRPRTTSVTLRRRSARRKKSSFFFKFFLFLCISIALVWGGMFGVRYLRQTLEEAQITDWHVKSVELIGTPSHFEKDIYARLHAWEGKAFSMNQAEQLREEIRKAYPMFARVSVKRRLLSGCLRVSVSAREPIACFKLPDGSLRYVDKQSVVYADPYGPKDALTVKLLGEVPDKLQPAFVDLVQELIRLHKALPFEALTFNLTENTVAMTLPEKTEIYFATAEQLKEKVQRAAQIMAIAREKHMLPARLDFTFFKEGKVFLTQQAH